MEILTSMPFVSRVCLWLNKSGFCTYFYWVNPRNFSCLLKTFRRFSSLSVQQCPVTGVSGKWFGVESDAMILSWWVWKNIYSGSEEHFQELQFRFLYWCSFGTWLCFCLLFYTEKVNSTKPELPCKIILACSKQIGFCCISQITSLSH